MTTESRAAFARRHGVNRSTVTRWEKKGRLVFEGVDLIDVEASQASLDGRPEVYRGGRAKGRSAKAERAAAVAIAQAEVRPDPVAPEDLAIDGFGLIVREIGAFAAERAIEFGASLEIAYALDQAVCMRASEIADDYLTGAGIKGFSGGWSILEYQGMRVVEPDWDAIAARLGVPLDLDALSENADKFPYFKPKPVPE